MGLIKTGIQMGAGYAMMKTAVGAIEKHDQNKFNQQQQYQQQQQHQQFTPPQQSSRAPDGGQVYGKFIAPDGTEYPVYQPQPQFTGGSQQPAQPQSQSSSRSIGYEPYQPQHGQQSIRQGSASPIEQQYYGQKGYVSDPTISTPPAYHQYDRKS